MKNINAFYGTLFILFLGTLAAKLAGLLSSWSEVPLWFMVLVLFFAGITHFTPIRHEFAKMIPPAIPAKMFFVYLTGVIEIAGAIDLVNPENRYRAGIMMIVFLIIVFPANVYAAKKNILFNGVKPPSLWVRLCIQILFIIALYIGAVSEGL